MPTEKKCPTCGKPFVENALMGLCPDCLLQAGLVTLDSRAEAAGKSPAFVPPTPEELARYFPDLEIIELLGRGGMGAVYQARQKRLDRLVALKILPPGVGHAPSFAERFEREAKALAQLHHPNIVTLYDSGQVDGLFYFFMEFVDGVNLRQLLDTGHISPKEALAIVPQICDALQFAHDRGIIHRDIKPENILLNQAGQVKIADFGVAKIVAREVSETTGGGAAPELGQTEAGKIIGTPQYMAPEQLSHPLDVDSRADIYALGVVFYQMLTGELPAGKFEPPSRKVQIDVRLDEVVLRALEKKPELRYQQASVMKTQVETIVSTPGRGWTSQDAPEPQPAVPPKATESVAPPRFSRTAIVGACWSPFFFAATAYLIFDRHTPFPHGYNPVAQLLIFLSFSALFGTTIIGWIAVSQIRRSAGKLYGLGLAVFDGLFFPLLALDYAIAFFINSAGIAFHVWTQNYDEVSNSWLTILSVIAWIVVDFFIIRAVWHAVNHPVNGSPTRAAESARNSSGMPALAVCAFCLTGLSGLLGVVAFCIMPNSYPVLDGAIPLAALIGISLGIVTSKTALGKAAIIIGGINLAICLFVQALTFHLEQASPTSAQFHYRVFVDDAPFVDNLIPLAQRQNGVMPNVRPLVFQSQVSAVSANGINPKTDSQLAIVGPEILDSLAGGMEPKPGLLVNQTEFIPPWPDENSPGIGSTKGFVFANREFSASGNVNGFLKADSDHGVLQARIEAQVTYLANNNPGLVQSTILYDGPAPQPGALAFLIPFQRNDGSTYYLVVAYEIGGSPDRALSTGNAPNVHFFRSLAIILVALSVTSLLVFFVVRALWPTAHAASDSKKPLPPTPTVPTASDKPWLVYGGALIKILPLGLSWGFCFVFLIPKLRQLFVDRADGQVTDAAPFLKVVFQVFGPGVPTLIFFFFLAIALAEWLLPVWRRHRRTLLFVVTMGVNALALASLLSLGIMASVLASENTYPVSGAIDPALNLAFGPVVEQVITDGYDLDHGRSVPLPVSVPQNEKDAALYRWITAEGNHDWWRQHGVQLVDKQEGLVGVDLEKVTVFSPDQWQIVNPNQLVAVLHRIEPNRGQADWNLPAVDVNRHLNATYGFQTPSGTIGLLQVLDEQPSGVKIRYKLVRTEATTSIPTPSAPVAELFPSFGPVIEREVPEDSVIAFKDGNVFELPDEVTNDHGDFDEDISRAVTWMEQHDVDAHAMAASLTGFGTAVLPLAAGQWEQIAPGTLQSQLNRQQAVPEVRMDGARQLPATYGFKTREGDLGILQIVGLVKDGGVKIRYKLVPASPAPTGIGTVELTGPDPKDAGGQIHVKLLLDGASISLPSNTSPATSAVSTQAQSTSFGPVIERTIEKGNPAHRALNLATGNFMTPSRGRNFVFSPAGADTLREAGVDLYVSDDAQAPDNIDTLDMRAWLSIEPGAPDQPPIDLDKITVEDFNRSFPLADRIRSDLESNPAFLAAGVDLKKVEPILRGKNVYVFATRDGARGLLQIDGLSDHPPGVKIRYKLLPVGPADSGPDASRH